MQVNAVQEILTLVLFVFCISDVVAQEKRPGDDFLSKFDLDGDGVNDRINFDFSGGAHCCYKISIILSSDRTERTYPFQMDGGYVGTAGIDNSKPYQFDIRDADGDGLPEILMQIQTYNGIAQKIPRKWRRKYHITGNHIMIEYENCRLEVKDSGLIPWKEN